MNLQLLTRFLEAYPFQPATAVWRAPEIAEVVRVRLPPGRGLDVGCGDGRLTRVLMEQAGPLRLTGVDYDPLETALASAEGVYERVLTGSADSLAEPDASFDYILSISVLEHIPDIDAVIRETARVLRADGLMVVTVPGPGFHACLRGPLWPLASRTDYLAALDRRLAHLRYWTTAEWSDAFRRHHFELVSALPFQSRAEVVRWETVSRCTAGLLHLLARGRAPIQIQRSLGLRRPAQRLPRPLARVLARLLAAGLGSSNPKTEADAGCLLLVARRTRSENT